VDAGTVDQNRLLVSGKSGTFHIPYNLNGKNWYTFFEKISHAVFTCMRSQYRYCTRTSTNISEYEGTKKLSPFFLLVK
jgi:hypothetical protein